MFRRDEIIFNILTININPHCRQNSKEIASSEKLHRHTIQFPEMERINCRMMLNTRI